MEQPPLLIDLVENEECRELMSAEAIRTEPFIIHMGFASVNLSGPYKNGARRGKWTGIECSRAAVITYTCDWQTGIATITRQSGASLRHAVFFTGSFSLAANNHIRYGDDWRSDGKGQGVIWKPDCGEIIWDVRHETMNVRCVLTSFHQNIAAYLFVHKESGTMSCGGARFCRGSQTRGGLISIDGKNIYGEYLQFAGRPWDMESDILQAEDGLCYDRSGKRVRLIGQPYC